MRFLYDWSNPHEAPRVVKVAPGEEGVQEAVVEALFRAYFTEGRDIGHTPTLLNVTAGAGLDRGRAEGLLRSGEGLAEVLAAEERARRMGVQCVPYFVIDGEAALSGAGEVIAFLHTFDRAESLASTAEGGTCQAGAGGESTC